MEKLRASDAEKTTKIERLEKSLVGVRQVARRVSELLTQQDAAEAHTSVEKEAAEGAEARREETQLELTMLQEEHAYLLRELSSAATAECSCLKSLLASTEERVTYLASEAHQDEVIQGYRSSTLGRLETVLAYKAGYDFLVAQLPTELREELDRLCRPPIIAPYIYVLSKLEREGGGYDVGETDSKEEVKDKEGHDDGSGEGEDEGTMEAGESSTGVADREGVEKESLTTLPLGANAALPPTPRVNLDPS